MEVYGKALPGEIVVWIRKTKRAWNTPLPVLGWIKSCCEGSDGDITKTGLSSVGGRGGGSLAVSATTTATCRWMAKQVALDATIVEESKKGSDRTKVNI